MIDYAIINSLFALPAPLIIDAFAADAIDASHMLFGRYQLRRFAALLPLVARAPSLRYYMTMMLATAPFFFFFFFQLPMILFSFAIIAADIAATRYFRRLRHCRIYYYADFAAAFFFEATPFRHAALEMLRWLTLLRVYTWAASSIFRAARLPPLFRHYEVSASGH